MKYAKQILTILLLFVFTFVEISAQTVKLKRDAQSSGTLGTIPANTFPIYSGLQTVGKGMKVYFAADTAGGVTSITWTLVSQPAGSNTTLSSLSDQKVTFVPDSTGYYIVKVEVNGGAFAQDTILAATYRGYKDGEILGCVCHDLTSGRDWQTVVPKWQASAHAKIFQEGITGQLEAANVNGLYKGTYGPSCIKCHTTGWSPKVDNGNYGYEAMASGFDTTWYKTFTKSGSSYLIPTNDMTAWNLLTTDPANAKAARVAFIGCESCHGPASAHQDSYGNPNMISKSLDAGVCNQCHDAPTHHMVGHYYNASAHGRLPNGEHTAQTGCFPCHSGQAYYKYSKNPAAPQWTNADGDVPISCAVCHEAHVVSDDNLGLRIVPVTLQNGYSVTEGGNGQLCMTCHQSRKDIRTTITDTPPYYGFTDRYGPHHGPQADMYLGRNAYDYGNGTLDGLMTHGSVKDACVTCHMADRGATPTPNHEFSLIDTTGGADKDIVSGCVPCHGPITSFDDIQASSDLDGNGKVEGVQTEVAGMLANLAALLPHDASGAVVSRMADSLAIKNKPNVVKGIYTYYFVSEDKSMGVHNAKYTIGILSEAMKALGSTVPVELTSFNASAGTESVTLKWETATETNNNGFQVERKISNDWQSVGFVKGNGTVSQFSKYSFKDDVSQLNADKAVYRLKQIDLDGSFKYSKEVEVTLVAGPKEYTLFQNYPNPFNPSTTIKYAVPFESNVKISVYNITGQLIKVLVNSEQPTGNHEVTFSTNSNNVQLSSGIYFYTIEAQAVGGSGSFRQTKKMVLMK
jgi:Secretion system C-terminal sorting domain